jgi:flagellar FliL protein
MDEKIDMREGSDSKKGGLNIKVFVIGLPLFIIQLVLVYFITGNFLLNRFEKSAGDSDKEQSTKVEKGKAKNKGAKAPGESNFFFTVDDVIINPAGTNGQRLMLVSVGLGVNSDEEAKKLKEKEVLVKDIVISTLGSKTLTDLSQTYSKDSLKVQLTKIFADRLPDMEINSVYFPKYIIQ